MSIQKNVTDEPHGLGAETQGHQGQREGKQQQMAAIPLFVREELEMGGREEGEREGENRERNERR